jgi:formylglycine-generating enzyme required for sulfatase activity
MVGNVWEWCCDWRNRAYDAWSPLTNPHGPEPGERLRILKVAVAVWLFAMHGIRIILGQASVSARSSPPGSGGASCFRN